MSGVHGRSGRRDTPLDACAARDPAAAGGYPSAA